MLFHEQFYVLRIVTRQMIGRCHHMDISVTAGSLTRPPLSLARLLLSARCLLFPQCLTRLRWRRVSKPVAGSVQTLLKTV